MTRYPIIKTTTRAERYEAFRALYKAGFKRDSYSAFSTGFESVAWYAAQWKGVMCVAGYEDRNIYIFETLAEAQNHDDQLFTPVNSTRHLAEYLATHPSLTTVAPHAY